MNKEEFVKLSINPNLITKNKVIELESIIDEFPYFQSAQVLHLKGLSNNKSFKYNNFLKKVAAHSTNRSVLFDFITSDVLNVEASIIKEKNKLANIEVVDSVTVIEKPKEVTAHLEKEIIDEVKINTILNSELKDKTDKLEIGKPLSFDKSDEFSFNEWLKLSPKKEIIRAKKLINVSDSKKNKKDLNKDKLSKQVSLIEKFILKKPKIKPPKHQINKDVALKSVSENSNIMTETLARVYLEQKKYDKAISAFKILSLKYPEKSSFFADRIKAIKFIQKHKT